MPYGVNQSTGKPGPAPYAARDADRKQARQRINVEVRTGYRCHPNELPCSDCGHQWHDGERRHEFHHHLGYAAEHHLDVIALCTACHAKRDQAITHCLRAHEYTLANTGRKANGTRFCRECRRVYDRGRRDAAYWRAYRAKRRQDRKGVRR